MDFDEQLMENIKKCGFIWPRKIQEAVLPFVADGYNVQCQSETGTGKTASYLIPLIDNLIKEKQKFGRLHKGAPYCIIIAPTREFAEQIYQEARKLTNDTGITVAAAYGGTTLTETRWAIPTLPLEALTNFERKENERLKELADKERLQKLDAENKKTKHNAKEAESVQIENGKETAKDVFVAAQKKKAYAKFIFANGLAKDLTTAGFHAHAIHSELSQNERDEVLWNFKYGDSNSRILVSVNICSSGIDIPDMDYVINYYIPDWRLSILEARNKFI
uniref:RNA helicase n=1 Tax=Panagrolaimus sp. ES5 TaxID=591445 RepID=A0AC34FK35_9BILA